ncbi:hypothetical protein BC938DRAFT_470864 [Jimgerdemannia flammicorona]|uniref:Uncharacterized protein n=1 Tax=Jimgerdemannia flammicorona TaxID=994334 RepID=A0A433Q999_9FUNG|nr:hypothetical protein BC938DRAFT_470864 [Jimgerdemannia flammicorona]
MYFSERGILLPTVLHTPHRVAYTEKRIAKLVLQVIPRRLVHKQGWKRLEVPILTQFQDANIYNTIIIMHFLTSAIALRRPLISQAHASAGLHTVVSKMRGFGSEKMFVLFIRYVCTSANNKCMDSRGKNFVAIWDCADGSQNQDFNYNEDSGLLYHHHGGRGVYMHQCVDDNDGYYQDRACSPSQS